MGLEGTSLWGRIGELARGEGVELFDVELPSDTRRGGVLRVFITRMVTPPGEGDGLEVGAADEHDGGGVKPPSRSSVSFEDCVRVSKRILDADEEQEIIPAHCTLEVSSPGINRKLRLPEHFRGAIGERVRVKFRSLEKGVAVTVNGIVRVVTDDSVHVEEEPKGTMVCVPLMEIKEARVDFKF